MADAPVVLRHRAEFEEALAHYEPSEHARNILASTELVILLGVTAGGRNTIINALVETGRYQFILSDTTRPPKMRDGRLEEDGVQYFFRSEEDILMDIRAGEYLEAEVIHDQQVSGTSIRGLSDAVESGKIPINEIDVGGAVNVLNAKPDAHMIFIVPPGYDRWIERLNGRENMSDQELKNRMRRADIVLSTALANSRFYFVLNDQLGDAVADIRAVVEGDRESAKPDVEARQIALEIHDRVKARLTDWHS